MRSLASPSFESEEEKAKWIELFPVDTDVFYYLFDDFHTWIRGRVTDISNEGVTLVQISSGHRSTFKENPLFPLEYLGVYIKKG